MRPVQRAGLLDDIRDVSISTLCLTFYTYDSVNDDVNVTGLHVTTYMQGNEVVLYHTVDGQQKPLKHESTLKSLAGMTAHNVQHKSTI